MRLRCGTRRRRLPTHGTSLLVRSAGQHAQGEGGDYRAEAQDDGDALVVGIMTDRRGVPSRKALYVVAAEDPWDESPKVRTVSFEGVGKVTAFAVNGPVPLRRTADGRRYAFDLKSNGAVLVVFEMQRSCLH